MPKEVSSVVPRPLSTVPKSVVACAAVELSGRGSRSRSQSGEDADAALELELAVSFRARFENFCPLLSPREFLFVD
jgi:hypothetical protein